MPHEYQQPKTQEVPEAEYWAIRHLIERERVRDSLLLVPVREGDQKAETRS